MSSGKDRHTNTLLLPDFIQFLLLIVLRQRGFATVHLRSFPLFAYDSNVSFSQRNRILLLHCARIVPCEFDPLIKHHHFLWHVRFFLLGSSFGAKKQTFGMKMDTIANNGKD